MSIYSAEFWRAAFERGVKSVAYGAISVLVGNGTGLIDTDWIGVVSVAGMAGLLSILGSVASDAATGGTGPSLTTSETLARVVSVQAPVDAHVAAEVTMTAQDVPVEEPCPEDHPRDFGTH